MHPIKQAPPAALNPAQRIAEIAALLANGLVRLRAANAQAYLEGRSESGFDLGFSAHQRVHTDTVNQSTESR